MAEPGSGRPRVARLTGGDAMQWLADVTAVPHHIGAVLTFAPGDRPAVDTLLPTLAQRLAAVPRLGLRPVRAPRGAGGWYWADDDRDPTGHLRTVTLAHDTEPELLDAAVAATVQRFPGGRSPWGVTVLALPDRTAAAVALALHHVLADGSTGRQLLAALVDPRPGVAGAGPAPRPAVPPPPTAALFRDAAARRLAALRRPGLGALARALREGRGELGHGSGRAPRSVLNRPTGPRRRVRVLDVPDAGLGAAAQALSASVNDLVLVAAAECLRAEAATAGQPLPRAVLSVPVAARRHRGGTGNAVGVMPIPVPTRGPVVDRVAAVTRQRLARMSRDPGRSYPLVLLAFRAVHGLHLTRWFLDHQRLVNSLVTAVPTLPGPVRLGGAPVASVTPLVFGQGNTVVCFATTRYAGRLRVAVATDPDTGPDAERMVRRLGAALAELSRRRTGLDLRDPGTGPATGR